MALVIVVAVVGGSAYQVVAPRLAAIARPRARGTFEVRDVEWKRTERPPDPALGTHAMYDGKARIVGTGELATGRYLVVFELIRSKRLNPALPPDTGLFWVPSIDGGSNIIGQDWAFTCTDLDWRAQRVGDSISYCARRLQDPEARFQVAGWVRLAESGRTRP